MHTIRVPAVRNPEITDDSVDHYTIELSPDVPTIFVGPNGSGKTRLGVLIEQAITDIRKVRRVAAQRSIALNDRPSLLSFEESMKTYHLGNSGWNDRNARQLRYGQTDPAIKPLADFDAVLQALYAEQAQVAVKHNQKLRHDSSVERPVPKLEELADLWSSVLPHRSLNIGHGQISISVPGQDEESNYAASKMSDGERVIFYMLGQALLADQDAVLIVDEPELHIHKSILGRLWDEIEGARPDLSLVYITHDLEFASTRASANIYGIEEFLPSGPSWKLAKADNETGLPDTVLLKILGSRQNILFVEGEPDAEIFRLLFPEYNVISVGSHERVIHNTRSFNSNSELHHKSCFGLIDRDGRSDEQVEYLSRSGVHCLPTSEIENFYLLPDVWAKILAHSDFASSDIEANLQEVKTLVLNKASENLDGYAIRQTKRDLDRKLKSMGLSECDNAVNLEAEWNALQQSISITDIVKDAKGTLEGYIEVSDVSNVLKLYDDKSMLAEVITHTFNQRPRAFKQRMLRALKSEKNSAEEIRRAMISNLPTIT